MAYLWGQDDEGSWNASLLCEPRYPLTANGAIHDSEGPGGGGRAALPAPPALIQAVNAAGAECWQQPRPVG